MASFSPDDYANALQATKHLIPPVPDVCLAVEYLDSEGRCCDTYYFGW